MSTYYHSACHDCKVVGMLPKSNEPEYWHKKWVEYFGHSEHRTEHASEYNEQFEEVTTPYVNITNETLNL